MQSVQNTEINDIYKARSENHLNNPHFSVGLGQHKLTQTIYKKLEKFAFLGRQRQLQKLTCEHKVK